MLSDLLQFFLRYLRRNPAEFLSLSFLKLTEDTDFDVSWWECYWTIRILYKNLRYIKTSDALI